jgi:hypothetical protein
MMNDETEQFESRLSRQPLRQIPGEWRAEILRVGRRAAVPKNKWAADTASLPKWNWRTSLAEIFWPHPKAWAGLTVVWICIFVVNFSMRDSSPRMAEKSVPPSPEVMVELKEQQRMFVELAGLHEPSDADRQKLFLPRPRSERVEILMT